MYTPMRAFYKLMLAIDASPSGMTNFQLKRKFPFTGIRNVTRRMEALGYIHKRVAVETLVYPDGREEIRHGQGDAWYLTELGSITMKGYTPKGIGLGLKIALVAVVAVAAVFFVLILAEGGSA